MNIFEKLAEMKANNQPFVIANVVRTNGSVPGKTGFKMVVDGKGNSFGTVGGGEIEQRTIVECLSRLENGDSGLQEYLLQEKAGEKKKIGEAEVVPMMCSGRMWIYYDVNRNRTPVYLFGGGHVGQALAYFLNKLDYHLVLIDNREEFAGENMNPHCHERILSEYPRYANEFTPPAASFVVIMTQGHGFDYDVLKTLYERKLQLKYIGVIASRAKSAGLLKQLRNDFGESVNIANLYTPVGLDIGGSTESEIALSIAAQIQAIRFEKTANHLRRKSS